MEIKSISLTRFIGFLLTCVFLVQRACGKIHYHHFVVKSTPYTRLCKTKNILTVNGQFPGPTLYVHRGDTVVIKAHNHAQYNITLHWHGVKQPRNPWSDGPAYITQCPIQSGRNYTYRLKLTNEEGTLWWHAHDEWARATVHGAIIVYPKRGTEYPFPKPHAEIPIILGEWWNTNVMEIPRDLNLTGGEPRLSDAYTINGQPGHLYPCSKKGTFRALVTPGHRYLLRIINAVMDEELFFAIAQHKLTLVGTDGSYTKPLTNDYIMITPGQTMDLLLVANQPPNLYLMASRAYQSAIGAGFDKTTTTAILRYDGPLPPHRSSPSIPTLPFYNDTQASTNFTQGLRSLANDHHPIHVPLDIDTHLFFATSLNLRNCTSDKPCKGPFARRFAASMNNVSFVTPSSIDILRSYYFGLHGTYDEDFPSNPPVKFNYTGTESLFATDLGTKVKFLEYNASVELVLQGTTILAGDNHPMHLHGYSFYVVGWGFGNFDPERDPLRYNLVDPPLVNTVGVPNSGWVAIRFKADNPGVWFMHCHLERHQIWGMSMVFIVKNGPGRPDQLLPPPPDLPKC